jgi:uncharacterized protein (DUF2345 family)
MCSLKQKTKNNIALEAPYKNLKAQRQQAVDEARKHADAWIKAVKEDKWFVSLYSQEAWDKDLKDNDLKDKTLINWWEDFAEHCAAYMLAYGTPCEALMRERMPKRAAILDDYFHNKPNLEAKPSQNKDENADEKKEGNSGSTLSPISESAASGGGGQTIAYSDPLMVMSAPAGITMVTPQSASFNAGSTSSIAAGQDINLLAQANAGYSVKGGISLFTYGKASNPKKPNQEVGIKLHAASGKVSSQSQSDKTQITADKGIQVNSTTDAVTIQAKQHVLLTAGGAYIKMSGGNIEVHAPGMVDFKAAMKSWTSAKSDSNSLKLAKGDLKACAMKIASASQSGGASVAR